MKLYLIAATGKNRELGWKGDMPWKRALKKDLQFFRRTTAGHPMVMGRKTFESLPGMLPDRKHLVITSSSLPPAESLQTYSSLEAFENDWKDTEETLFCIGGGSLYEQLLPKADGLILTEIDQSFKADTWFPAFDPSRYTRAVLDEVEENGYTYRHVLYSRRLS